MTRISFEYRQGHWHVKSDMKTQLFAILICTYLHAFVFSQPTRRGQQFRKNTRVNNNKLVHVSTKIIYNYYDFDK